MGSITSEVPISIRYGKFLDEIKRQQLFFDQNEVTVTIRYVESLRGYTARKLESIHRAGAPIERLQLNG